MRYFRFFVYTKVQLFQLLAIFLLGIILGVVMGTTIMGQKVDTLSMDNHRMLSESRDMEARLKRLEESLEERRRSVVRSTKVIVNLEDERLRLRIQDVIQDLVKDLVGREVQSVDPPLLESMINQRVVTLDYQDYILTLTGSHVSQTVTIYVNVKLGKLYIQD